MATSALSVQNFYETTLSSGISSTDTTIPLNTVPTVTEGYLIIEPDSASAREIIYFTSKTSNSVVLPSVGAGRGVDGTSASSHSSGATVRMVINAQYWKDLQTLFTTTPQGWTSLGYTPNTVTYNGNRSYDLVFNSTDLTSTISPGARLKLTRTVTAPTYMGGAFNGTNHYFTKATPSGSLGTVTNNFTAMCFYEPTTYAQGVIGGRGDATSANGIFFRMESDGRITLGVSNGGASNVRYVSTYLSLPLNKKTHIAASWTSGTVVIYFDGISVPVATATTGGTAPTTAGTGGDFSIGRWGAGTTGGYAAGYVSNFAVFDAVLSASTIKSYIPQSLSGAETNCIGYWSLNNVATDATASANNLTATNSVSYTARTPYTQTMTGITAGTTNHAIVQAASFSTNTTLTVQVAEGETIPTSGGVSAVSYSQMKAPYGFPSQRGKWVVETHIKTNCSQNAATAGTWYNLTTTSGTSGGSTINIPVGEWVASYKAAAGAYAASARADDDIKITLSTANNTESNAEFTAWNYISPQSGAVNGAITATLSVSRPLSVSAQATYYLNVTSTTASTNNISIRGDFAPTIISAENAYL